MGFECCCSVTSRGHYSFSIGRRGVYYLATKGAIVCIRGRLPQHGSNKYYTVHEIHNHNVIIYIYLFTLVISTKQVQPRRTPSIKDSRTITVHVSWHISYHGAITGGRSLDCTYRAVKHGKGAILSHKLPGTEISDLPVESSSYSCWVFVLRLKFYDIKCNCEHIIEGTILMSRQRVGSFSSRLLLHQKKERIEAVESSF